MVAAQRSALIVEDNPDFRDLLARFLEPWRLEVVTSATVTDALQLVSSRSYDLYLIDLRLADADATELLTLLAHQGSSRCIVVTAFPAFSRSYTTFPIVSKTELAALGPDLLRILGPVPRIEAREPCDSGELAPGDHRGNV